MKVAPAYRSVLKQLRTACSTHPHFVHDIRFLLSLPMHTPDNEPHTVVPTPAASSSKRASSSVGQHEHAPGDGSLPAYLQRPSAECYPIDRDVLFAMSYADLRGAVHDTALPASAPGSAMHPVARQILQYRNLLWLKERLASVLSDKTQQLLTTSISISRGPGDDDFIPDDAFAAGGDAPDSETPGAAGAGATRATAPAPGVSAVVRGATAAEAVDESDPAVVYSAGAIGLQQEMFVLRHREAFPMAAQFLTGFPTLTSSELAACGHQQAALTELARQKLPTTVTCMDAHVSLTATAAPYDAEYTSKEHAGVGYFAAAHRQFRVQFSLEPLSPDGTGAERSEVLVVNSHFVRLDMELMQLVEEVGYLHSRDVLRMLRERDYGDHFSTFIGSGVADVLGEGVLEGGEDTASGNGAASSADAATSQPTPAASDGAHVFSLYFANPSDAPMVLKGMLYYKLAKRRDLAQAPIRCLPFGFLLLEA